MSFAVFLCAVLTAGGATADEVDATRADPRPIRFASVEVNPLALLVGRVGGQAQLALYGPLTLVGSAAHVHMPGGQHYSEYDETVVDDPTVTGWSFELGPRAYVGLASRPNRVRLDLWLGASYLHDALHEEGALTCSGSSEGLNCATGSPRDIARDGFALDVGFQATTPVGFYVLAGLGHQWTSASAPFSRGDSIAILPTVTDVMKSDKAPRILLSLGWAF
jgi:hypothetical protein